MKTETRANKVNTEALCNIKGRMLPYGEFLGRVKNFCISLGFKKRAVAAPLISMTMGLLLGEAEVSFAKVMRQNDSSDSVIILTSRLPYEPSWGGFGQLPKTLLPGKAIVATEGTTSDFITPYLRQYTFAQTHIFLSMNSEGKHLITIPERYIQPEETDDDSHLKVVLENIADPDNKGHVRPVSQLGPFFSFFVGDKLLKNLADKQFTWRPEKSVAICQHLSADLISFSQPSERMSNNSFALTLLPAMNKIVTNQTPHLLAAELQLQSDFRNTVSVLEKSQDMKERKILCLAGLEIDMDGSQPQNEHYFVPWKAYLYNTGKAASETQLQQDALFCALMKQDKQCSL